MKVYSYCPFISEKDCKSDLLNSSKDDLNNLIADPNKNKNSADSESIENFSFIYVNSLLILPPVLSADLKSLFNYQSSIPFNFFILQLSPIFSLNFLSNRYFKIIVSKEIFNQTIPFLSQEDKEKYKNNCKVYESSDNFFVKELDLHFEIKEKMINFNQSLILNFGLKIKNAGFGVIETNKYFTNFKLDDKILPKNFIFTVNDNSSKSLVSIANFKLAKLKSEKNYILKVDKVQKKSDKQTTISLSNLFETRNLTLKNLVFINGKIYRSKENKWEDFI